jgi:hypothetical protein
MYYNKLQKLELVLAIINKVDEELNNVFKEPQPGNYTQQEIKNHLEKIAHNRYKKNNINK